ncbi:hypothetical protein Tco_0584932 [Tanacetum coccineum]
MYTFSPMMVANSQKHHCRVRTYTREVLVLSTNLKIQTKHCPLVFKNRRGDEARIKKTIMSSITAQQTKLDLELVPKENRFDIKNAMEESLMD